MQEVAMTTTETIKEVPKGLITLLALVCGVSIASGYYAQPLLGDIGRSLGVSEAYAGALPMFTQIGIAIGALLFLPLGDIVNDRKLILAMISAHVGALVLVALAPSAPSLTWASALMGVTTITPYLLPAYAAKIVGHEQRGHVTGLLARGIFAGILLARTASGYIGHYTDWRTVYWIAAALMLFMTALLAWRLPPTVPRSDLSYPRLLASIWTVFRQQPVVRYAAARQGLVFGAFNAFWISLVFYLETPRFHMGSDVAGLFGVIGAAGAFAAPLFGKVADKRGPVFAVRLGTGSALLAWVVMALFGQHLAGLVAGVLLLDLGVTASHVSNQTMIYHLGQDIRGRVSTIYILGIFIGAAVMSGLTAWVWSLWAWHGVSALGIAATGLAVAVSFAQQDQAGRGGLQPQPAR
jgi:predicted MFS family arabinose efflux permease